MENYYSQQMPVNPISLEFSPPLQDPHAREFSDVNPETALASLDVISFLQTREASSGCSRAWSCVVKGGFSEYVVICGGGGQVGISETFAKT